MALTSYANQLSVSNGRKESFDPFATLSGNGRYLRTTVVHHAVPANRRGFRVDGNPRNSRRLVRRIAVCEPNSDRSSAFCVSNRPPTAGALRESRPTNANRWNSQLAADLLPPLARDLLRVTRAVFCLLQKELERGETEKIIATLPHPLRVLWPAPKSQETPPL